MESKQTGRVVLIMAVLLVALYNICPQPWTLLHGGPIADKLKLRGGIDIQGGTSLLYQFKTTSAESASSQALAEEMVKKLKARVDPSGVKNYIWRPQGDNRIEIQIPSSAENDQAVKLRDEYVAARTKLDQLNPATAEIESAAKMPAGPDRIAKLTALAGGSAVRLKLYTDLAKTSDDIRAARDARQADKQALAENLYDGLKAQIDATTVRAPRIEGALAETDPQKTTDLNTVKALAGTPERVALIDQFIAAYQGFKSAKGSTDDAATLKRDLKGSGVLEFHIVATNANGLDNATYGRMAQQLAAKGPRSQAGDDLAWFQVDREEDIRKYSPPPQKFNDKWYALCWITPKKSMVNGPGIPPWTLETVQRGSNAEGQTNVSFEFDTTGGSLFHDFTAGNVGQQLAAILDRRIVSAANINEAIGKKGQISGTYTDEDLSYMVTTLGAGSLPAQLEDEPISEHTVGPQLGADNLRKGLYACALGLVVVAVFLVAYYYLAGVVATIAVLMNVVLILGILSAFNATFTLPGIAGIVLTIGAAVDANVLIFERLREEQHAGLSLRMAMRNAYAHARSAIFDSNATTVITSLILYVLGSEEVKGFGITLLIGLLSSLFTSLFVTRTIFNILIDTFNVQNLSSIPLTFPKWDKLLRPHIDWMRFVPYFVVLSTVIIVSGLTAFVVKARQHELADVDFASGTQIQFDLKEPSNVEVMQNLFESANNPSLPSPRVTPVSADNKSFEIVTPNPDARIVREAVMNVLGPKITTDLPSRFDHVADTVDVAQSGGAVLPITPAFSIKTIPNYKIPEAENYVGGVAVVLNNITPQLRPDQIRDRLDRQRAAMTSKSSDLPPAVAEYTVLSPNGPNQPTSTAVVLAVDPSTPFDKDSGKWSTNVAEPVWKLVTEGVNKEGKLQKVNTFGPQVAGDNQLNAFMALALSTIVIMAYIWFRFGNLRYGTATVLAMVHDVLLVIAAIGLSHYLVKWTPGLASLLLVEPFRVNLTIVAAVLTVMSYSMIDTIVVFDRVRENRGKFGHLSRQIVNDSINQTLSRTLLTAGTTIVTVAGMFIVGGPSIHGFTFVLLIGILVGTYSSIAIAVPILLVGADAKEPAVRRIPPTSLQGATG